MPARRRTFRWALAVFCLGLAGGLIPTSGCGAACRDRVAAMQAVFAGLPQIVHDEPSFTLYLDHYERGSEDMVSRPPAVPLDLPRSTQGEPVDMGVVLVMQANGHFLDSSGRPAATVQEAVGELIMKVADTGAPVLLAFEQGAPLEPIAELIHLLADPQPNNSGASAPPAAPVVQLLAYPLYWRAPSEDQLPAWMKLPIERLREQLHARMREQGPTLPPGGPLYVGVTCLALLDLMNEISTLSSKERLHEMVRRSPQVITDECGCRGVDVELFAAWLWLREEPWQPLVRGHLWAFGDLNAEVVKFPIGATVADLLPVVEARAGKPFRIAVAAR